MGEHNLAPLYELLCSLFNAEGLQRFITLGASGEHLARHLPSKNVEPAAMAFAVVEQLRHTGMLDETFFRRLSSEFPKRAIEISQVAEKFGIPKPPVDNDQVRYATHEPHRPRFLVVTALPLESRAMLSQLSELRERSLPTGTVVTLGVLRKPDQAVQVAVVQSGAGNVPAALVTLDAARELSPRAMLFVGVAGGIKDVRLGDVVVATRVYGYASGKVRQTFDPRPDVGQSAHRFEQRARADANSSAWLGHRSSPTTATPTVHVGPIAAGEVVVASTRSTTFRFLRKNYGDALAVEMEGRGFLAAAWIQHLEAVVIRGISDLIDKKSHADAQGSQPDAAVNAAAFAAEMMLNVRLND